MIPTDDFSVMEKIANWVWAVFMFVFSLLWYKFNEHSKEVRERITKAELDIRDLATKSAVHQSMLNSSAQFYKDMRDELRRIDEKIDRILESRAKD